MEKNLTMQDVADSLNLSRKTVSWVLNGHAEKQAISKATIKKVNDYVQSVGYKQNIGALSMKGKYSKNVAFITPSYVWYHHRLLYFKLMDFFGKSGISNIALQFSSRNTADLIRQLQLFGVKRMFVIAHSIHYAMEEWLKVVNAFPETNIFYYDLYKKCEKIIRPHDYACYFDRAHLSELIFKTLRKKGYERIFVPENHKLHYDIYSNQTDVHVEYMSRTSPYELPDSNFHEDELMLKGVNMARVLYNNYDMRKMRSAIYIDNEYSALGIRHFLREKSIKIPEEVGVVAMGAASDVFLQEMKLSSRRFPHKDMSDFGEKWLLGKEKSKDSGKLLTFESKFMDSGTI